MDEGSRLQRIVIVVVSSSMILGGAYWYMQESKESAVESAGPVILVPTDQWNRYRGDAAQFEDVKYESMTMVEYPESWLVYDQYTHGGASVLILVDPSVVAREEVTGRALGTMTGAVGVVALNPVELPFGTSLRETYRHLGAYPADEATYDEYLVNDRSVLDVRARNSTGPYHLVLIHDGRERVTRLGGITYMLVLQYAQDRPREEYDAIFEHMVRSFEPPRIKTVRAR